MNLFVNILLDLLDLCVLWDGRRQTERILSNFNKKKVVDETRGALGKNLVFVGARVSAQKKRKKGKKKKKKGREKRLHPGYFCISGLLYIAFFLSATDS